MFLGSKKNPNLSFGGPGCFREMVLIPTGFSRIPFFEKTLSSRRTKGWFFFLSSNKGIPQSVPITGQMFVKSSKKPEFILGNFGGYLPVPKPQRVRWPRRVGRYNLPSPMIRISPGWRSPFTTFEFGVTWTHHPKKVTNSQNCQVYIDHIHGVNGREWEKEVPGLVN